MAEAIGIRLEEDFLEVIDQIGKEESLDRSTLLRKLLKLGYSDFMLQKSKEKYLAGTITLSEAAKLSGITLWEMQKYLIEKGYISDYSIKDLEEDLEILEKK